MIDMNSFFDEIEITPAIWCGADTDGADLARMAGLVAERGINMISVVPSVVPIVWPWIEGQTVSLLGRFYISEDTVDETVMSDLTVRINSSFKQGANGAMVFVRYKHLRPMIDQVAIIRDDLFFNRDLIIGLDIEDIDSYDWSDLFHELKRINASAVCFVLTKDTGKKSDFVGRIYGMLNAWDSEFSGALHFALENRPERIEQARRLVESLRPELMSGLRFFVNY